MGVLADWVSVLLDPALWGSLLTAAAAYKIQLREGADRSLKILARLALFGGLMGLLGSLLSGREALRFEQEMRMAAEMRGTFEAEMRQEAERRVAFEQSVIDFEQRRVEFEVEQREAAQRLTEIEAGDREKLEDVLHTVTGGDSFAYAVFTPRSDDRFMLGVFTVGDHPVYDLTMRVTDLNKMHELEPRVRAGELSPLEMFEITDTKIALGNFAAGYGVFATTDWDFTSSERQAFNIFFFARNGDWTQNVRMLKSNGNWLLATQVQREEERIWDRIDPDFPRGADGEVEW